MGFQRPSIAAAEEEMDTFSWGSPTDAWPERRALCPKSVQETIEQKACLPRSKLFELFWRLVSLPLCPDIWSSGSGASEGLCWE